MKKLKRVSTFAVVLYLSVVAVFFVFQRHLLYIPTHTYTPLAQAHANRAFQEISVRTEDGVDLKAWYAPASGKPCTIVFFHGNGDSLLTASQVADPYIAAGYGFLVAEYRGYSGLPGSPTEAGLYEDARADLRGLTARGVDVKAVILFGHSLGTGVAVEMATEFHPDGVMLLAPYLSIPKAAQAQYPFLPASLLALDRYDSEKKIGSVHVPVLIANGAQDGVIPPSQGRKLYALANEPKEFHSLPGRGHNDAFDVFVPVSLNWLRKTCPSQ
ncbi:MAG: alpha/beta hydrolase [Terracidiphilus sp.]